MLRTSDEEAEDREQEAQYWQQWQDSGKQTDCLGTVAKVCIVLAFIVQSVIQGFQI